MADITARFRLDVSGIDAALTRVAAATLAAQGAFSAARAALAPLQGAFSAIKESLDLGGHLSDVSAQTGVAVGDLVVLRQAFANAGVGADAVGPAMNRMQKALSGVNEDGELTNAAFARLGLSLAQLQALSPGDQFAQISTAIAALPDATQRSAAAMGIFGRTGAQMMALFSDSSALQVAQAQVGGLAATMETNAGRFDAISDAFGAAGLKGQQFAAGVTAAIAPALEQIAEALNQTDLTSFGEAVGEMAVRAVELAQALSSMIPQIMGVVAAMALYRAGFDARLMGAMRGLAPAATSAFAQVRAAIASTSFSSMASGARNAFASIGIAARGAALAIKGALISTGIGILIAAIAAGIEAIIGKINRAKEAASAVASTGKETSRAVQAVQEEFKTISSEADKIAFGKRVEQELQSARDALGDLDERFKSLTPEQRDDIAVNYRVQISLLDRMRESVSKITPEVMAQRQAEKDRAEALAESARKAAGLNAELGKNKNALEKKIAESAFAQLAPEEQRRVTLEGAGAKDTADLDAQIAALSAKRESAALTNEEALRMQSLIEAREKMIDVERSIAREREQSLKKAQEEAKQHAQEEARRREFVRDINREVARAQASASGDKEGAERLEREARIDQETKQGVAAGLTPDQAARLAEQKVGSLDKEALAQKEQSNRATLAALDLETRLAEAKAAGNKEEARRIEWLQRYNSELERLKDIMPQDQAQAAAARLVNAQSTGEQPPGSAQGGAGALFSSSLARIGAGGNFVSAGSDPMLTETRRQTSFLEKIARALTRKDPTSVEISYTLA